MRKVRTLTDSEQKEFVPILTKFCTEDLDPSIRESSIRLLSELKAKSAGPAFLSALKDKADDVQLAAISGLRDLDVKSAGPPLTELIKSLDIKKDQSRITASLRTMGAIEYTTDLKFLLQKADESETHEEIRKAIVLYLGDIKSTEGTEYLTKLAKNEEKDADLRAYAVNSLGRMKEKSAVPMIKDILESIRNQKSSKERVRLSRLRYQSMIALMRLGDRSMIPEIMSAARDDDPVVRLRAVRQLGELRAPEAHELLVYKAKYDESPRIKKAAQQALDKWNDGPARPTAASDMDSESEKEK